MRQPHRGDGHRDGDGVAPRGRRLAGPARHRRPEDDGPRGAPLQEGGRHLERGGVLEVRVPAPRQGGLADHLQDQVQHGRPPLLPRALGRVRSGVRRGRRRRTPRARTRPTPRTPRCSATRTSTWRSTRRARTRRAAGNLPGVGHQIQEDSRRQVPPEGHDRRAEVDGPVVQPLRLLHPAGQERRRGPEAARRGQVRALPPLLRGAALGGGGGLLPGHRATTTRTTTRRSTPRSSTSRASTCSPSTACPTAPRASTT